MIDTSGLTTTVRSLKKGPLESLLTNLIPGLEADSFEIEIVGQILITWGGFEEFGDLTISPGTVGAEIAAACLQDEINQTPIFLDFETPFGEKGKLVVTRLKVVDMTPSSARAVVVDTEVVL